MNVIWSVSSEREGLRSSNFKIGRRQRGRSQLRFAKVTILILLLKQPSATNQNTQQHEASRGLSAIAELLVRLE